MKVIIALVKEVFGQLEHTIKTENLLHTRHVLKKMYYLILKEIFGLDTKTILYLQKLKNNETRSNPNYTCRHSW